MSRGAIDTAIIADSELSALGFDENSVLANYDGDERPNDEMFMVIHWGDEVPILRSGDGETRNIRPLTIWVHIYREFSTDYSRIDAVLNMLDRLIMSLVHVDGGDGYTMTLAEKNGRSRDLRDRTYETICRSISYKILSRETETV